MAAVIYVGEFGEDQAEDGGAIFGGAEVGVGAEIVGCGSEVVFELFELVVVHLCVMASERWSISSV
jgi:hypothetical protein